LLIQNVFVAIQKIDMGKRLHAQYIIIGETYYEGARMIRFIDLGKQIAPDPNDPEWMREFALYDTLEARFLDFGGQVVFDSREDLIENIDDNDPGYVKKILGLLPEWVPKDSRTMVR
jgi:hypothetical protein